MPTTYAIPNGRTAMDATIYTGTGSNVAITNVDNATVGFYPDLVWIKGRTNTGSHTLQDSNRGFGSATKLSTNSTNAENNNAADATDPIYGYVPNVTSNSFTVYAGTSPAQTNNSGVNYVAWQWNAGSNTAASNTNGTITSTVSANATAGFSIVKYTGTGTTGTVGHGLSAAPNMVVVKARNQADSWLVYHSGCPNPATNTLILNSNAAVQTSSLNWNSLAPTSTIFNVYNPGSGGYTNGNGYTYVAYCWTAIPGFSAFGSYTGNGSTDGPFLYFGFRPRWIMFKSVNYTSTDTHWNIIDTTRSPYNNPSVYLNADEYASEGTYTGFTVVSNGVKLINVGGSFNGNGSTYVYAAFAENPFKYANAR